MYALKAADEKFPKNFQSIQVKLHTYAWSPPTDVYETDDSLVIRVEVAGMRESDFSIRVDRNELVISGTRIDIEERRTFHQMEIRYGEFSTSVELPQELDINGSDAEYRNGFLKIILPKNKPAVIKVQG